MQNESGSLDRAVTSIDCVFVPFQFDFGLDAPRRRECHRLVTGFEGELVGMWPVVSATRFIKLSGSLCRRA